jgi:hypothetical protein
MKHIYSLIIVSVCLIGSAYGQDFVYITGEQHRIDTVINENYESYEIGMVTPTDENITFKWELVSNSFDPAWTTAVCDYTNCYVGFPSNATMNAITVAEMAAGTNGFIKVNITCGFNYGDGTVEIYVYDQNDYTRGDTVSFTIHWPAPATAVEENVLSIKTFPNPVSDQLTVVNQSPLQGQINVSDILGKTVFTNRIIAGETKKIDFSSFNNGIYLVKLTSDDGSTTTKKIVKR